MVVCTMTKKQILRIVGIVLAVIAAAVTVIFAVAGSVTASADTSKKPVCSVERSDNRVALTFDCAWDAGNIDELLETLGNTNIPATFFVTGEFCDAHADAVRKIAAAGHSVQCGSDKNIHIAGMNINDLIADTNENAKKIKVISNREPEFYRPPYGDSDDRSLTTLEGMGYTVVQWSIDSKDLDDPDSVSVRKRVLDSAVSGSIILFHNDSEAMLDALPDIITGLKKNGLEPVRIEDLAFRNNCYTDEKGVQHYQPAVSTVLPIVYCDYNAALDSAFEKMRENLTVQQIYDLSSVGRVGLVDDIKSFLNADELYAVREATYEELMDCYMVLVYAAENYGAGGTYTDPEPGNEPQIFSAPDEPSPTPDDVPVIPEGDPEPTAEDDPEIIPEDDLQPGDVSFHDKGSDDPETEAYPVK